MAGKDKIYYSDKIIKDSEEHFRIIAYPDTYGLCLGWFIRHDGERYIHEHILKIKWLNGYLKGDTTEVPKKWLTLSNKKKAVIGIL